MLLRRWSCLGWCLLMASTGIDDFVVLLWNAWQVLSEHVEELVFMERRLLLQMILQWSLCILRWILWRGVVIVLLVERVARIVLVAVQLPWEIGFSWVVVDLVGIV